MIDRILGIFLSDAAIMEQCRQAHRDAQISCMVGGHQWDSRSMMLDIPEDTEMCLCCGEKRKKRKKRPCDVCQTFHEGRYHNP